MSIFDIQIVSINIQNMPIYLDYCSTTPVNQRVSDLMQRLFVEDFGNSGSRTHLHGAKANKKFLWQEIR